jgi:hypothetical protein
LTESNFYDTIKLRAMKRLFQFASFVLVLLMLAPPVFASMQCGRNSETHNCPKSCCHGMKGMSMPMDQASTNSSDQFRETPCCTVAQTEISLPASPANAHAEDAVAHVSLPADLLPINLHPVHARIVEFPPGDTLLQPVLSRLCTFQI